MLDTLPEDIRHASRSVGKSASPSTLLSPDVQNDCIGWIEETDAPDARHRRIEIVLDSLKRSSEPIKGRATVQRAPWGLGAPTWLLHRAQA
jgi:hypothetical protein